MALVSKNCHEGLSWRAWPKQEKSCRELLPCEGSAAAESAAAENDAKIVKMTRFSLKLGLVGLLFYEILIDRRENSIEALRRLAFYVKI